MARQRRPHPRKGREAIAARRRRPTAVAIAIVVLAAALWGLRALPELWRPADRPVEPVSLAAVGGDAGAFPAAGVRAVRSRVREVIDGDSVRLQDGTELRYLGIDTPETDDSFHERAAARNRQLVEGRDVVAVLPESDEKDRYGRRLGVLYAVPDGEEVRLDAVDATTALLRDGLGHVYLKGDDAISRSLARRWIAMQNDAIDRRTGLWSSSRRLRADPDSRLRATRRRFHDRDCRHIRRLRHLHPTSREAAYRSGRSPRRTCRPE